jgi:YVTN family beta-propeller protein
MSLMNWKGHCGRLRYLLLVWLLLAMPLGASTVLIYVTNDAGDSIDVIDPVTNKIVQVIEGIEGPHAVVFSPDGSRLYISHESENKLVVLDRKTGRIIKKVPLSGHPENIAITKDGGRVLVSIWQQWLGIGMLDIVDTTTLKKVKSIPMNNGLHDVYVTPDGKYAVAGSVAGKFVSVIDLQTEQPVWEVKFDKGIHCIAFEAGPDGSTRRIFAQLGNYPGFAVVDFDTHKEVARITLPNEPSGRIFNPNAPSHGNGVAPDGKTFWVNSSPAGSVFVYSLPELKLLGSVPTGDIPAWLTFTPDSKMVYIANSMSKSVSAIDTKTLKEVARIPVGEVPKRCSTLVLTSSATPPSMATQSLDFEFFKNRVEPIFLTKRAGHARCYVCHSESRTAFLLEKLSPGSTSWTEEQSRRNFQNALPLVVPGDPTSSRLLMHALSPEAGGDPVHQGGRQFASQNDTDWLTLAEWVRRQEASGVRLQVKEDQ